MAAALPEQQSMTAQARTEGRDSSSSAAPQHRNLLDAGRRGAIIIIGEGGWLGSAAMPFPRRVIPKKPPIGQRRCPACGQLMFLASIEPTDQAHLDQRTYECMDCAFAETETVQFT